MKSLLGRILVLLLAALASIVGLFGIARLLERASLAEEFRWSEVF